MQSLNVTSFFLKHVTLLCEVQVPLGSIKYTCSIDTAWACKYLYLRFNILKLQNYFFCETESRLYACVSAHQYTSGNCYPLSQRHSARVWAGPPNDIFYEQGYFQIRKTFMTSDPFCPIRSQRTRPVETGRLTNRKSASMFFTTTWSKFKEKWQILA